MKDGDIFKWSYKPYVSSAISIQAGTQYWCCSRIAIFKDGILYDTYWGEDGGSEGRRWTKEEALKELDCKFIANKSDIRETKHPEYYHPDSVVDLSHPNNIRRAVCVFKDAERSRDVMKGLILKELGKAQSKIESANREIDWMSDKLTEIETADLNKFYV